MARKSRRKSASQARVATQLSGTNREKAIEAFMALLAIEPFEKIGLAEVAARAGLKLSELRAEFGSTFAILGAQIKEIDRKVLDGADLKMDEDPPRERLFEVLMRRLEVLDPYKDAVRSLVRSVARNPGLALALNAMAVRSQIWMLTAAGIGTTGPRGALRAQGAALLFGRVLGVWVEDETASLDRTMAALDRGLASAERWSGFLDDVFCIPAMLCRGLPPRRRARNFDGGVEADAA